MIQRNIIAVLSFVNQLELEEDKMHSATLKEQGFVNGGSLASFTSQLSNVHRSDVLHSILLAQLAASKHYDRNKETDESYKKYLNVLGKIGCVIQEFEFEKYEANSKTMKVCEAIVDIVKVFLLPSEIQAVKRVLKPLRSPQNEQWWNVFVMKSMSSSKIGSFQVTPYHEDCSGQVVMAFGLFYFTSTAREECWLRFQYNSPDVHLFKATQVATLNKVTYSTVLFVKCDFTDMVKDNGSTELCQPVRTGRRQSAFSYFKGATIREWEILGLLYKLAKQCAQVRCAEQNSLGSAHC